MGLPHPKQPFTPEEYLRLERDSAEKHEYYRGEIFAMAGGSPEHSLICANVIGELRNRLRGSACRPYDSNLRVRIPTTTLYTYPDVSVICGPTEFDPLDVRRESVLNPTLLIEVLSTSTEAYDRGAKFESYQQIASLREYLLVSQNFPRAETFLRQPDGTWLYSAAKGGEAVIRLASVQVELPVYTGINFPALAAAEGGVPG